MFILRQKINFSRHIFLEILERYCKLAILGTLGMPGFAHPKGYYHLVENFSVYLQLTSSPTFFIYMPKINFIIPFFIELLHSKESCTLIGEQHFGP